MPLVSDIIQHAYRRSGILPQGVTVSTTQAEVGLEQLQAWYRAQADGLFGAMNDTRLTSSAAYTAKEFDRIINPEGATITLPTTVQDLYSGEARPPLDCAIIVIGNIDGEGAVTNQTWVYDAPMGNWYDIQSLAEDNYAPLSTRWEDQLKNLLAVRLCDDIGIPVSKVLAHSAGLAKLKLAARHGSKRRPLNAEYY